jgi:hypothetical protein
MKIVRRSIALMLVAALVSLGMMAQAQRRRSQSTTSRNVQGAQSRLTGVYRLNAGSSDDPRAIAERASNNISYDERRRIVDDLTTRLTAPDVLAIERRGRLIDIASSRAPRISFEADGRERTEQAADGHTVTTRAVLYGDQLMVSSNGSPDDNFSVTFDPLDYGRRLRVTRRIYSVQLNQPLVIQSIYDKTSTVARWGIFREPQKPSPTVTARDNQTLPRITRTPPPVTTQSSRPQPPPPVIRNRPPQPEPTGEVMANAPLIVPNGTQLVGVLNNDLSTAQSHEGDRFTMTVRSPAEYEGAIIEGYVSGLNRGGRIAGRSEMRLNFEQIRLRDGRTADFGGYIESISPVGDEDVRVDTENGGGVQDRDNRSNRTAQRAAIGAAVGAIIGAIAGGGRGAAIGAAVGAGVGAGSVYVEGRDDLDLTSGTEMTIRASAQR